MFLFSLFQTVSSKSVFAKKHCSKRKSTREEVRFLLSMLRTTRLRSFFLNSADSAGFLSSVGSAPGGDYHPGRNLSPAQAPSSDVRNQQHALFASSSSSVVTAAAPTLAHAVRLSRWMFPHAKRSAHIDETVMHSRGLLGDIAYHRFWNPSVADLAMRQLDAVEAGSCHLEQLLRVPESQEKPLPASSVASSLLHPRQMALRTFSLRLCQLSYHLPQDDRSSLVDVVDRWDFYREECLRHLRFMEADHDGLVFFHAASATLIVGCRGTHLGEVSWARDLTHAALVGCDQRVTALEEMIARARSRLPLVRRVFVTGHSLGGAACLRYCMKNSSNGNIMCVVWNPGEIFMSVPVPFLSSPIRMAKKLYQSDQSAKSSSSTSAAAAASTLNGDKQASASAAANKSDVDRVAIVRKQFDLICRFVQFDGCVISEQGSDHALASFAPSLESGASLLVQSQERAGNIVVILCAMLGLLGVVVVTWLFYVRSSP